MLRELDPGRNGYVTNQELEDIFRSVYPEKLKNVSLKRIFESFASIQNKLLIDYKRLLQALQIGLNKRNQALDDKVSENEFMTNEDIRRLNIRPSKGVRQALIHHP